MFRDGDGTNDPDFIIHRDQSHVYEKSHNPYHPNLNLSSDLYFENQYTQQTERFEDPGFYLGMIDPQAIRSLHEDGERALPSGQHFRECAFHFFLPPKDASKVVQSNTEGCPITPRREGG